jgi:hypothetical protein
MRVELIRKVLKMGKVSKLKTVRTVPAKKSEPTHDNSRHDYIVRLHCVQAVPMRFVGSPIGESIADASYDLYRRLDPQDAQDEILASLIVSLTGASLDCITQAALVQPSCSPLREPNLKIGLKGAETVAELIKAFDDRHRAKPDKVTVGPVNVAAGGQAIVGTVISPPATASTKENDKK